jgi:chitin synthase
MKRKDIRMAWREKVAIFIIIATMCLGVLFFIILLPRLICPKEDILSIYEIEGMTDLNKAYVAVYGRYFDITELVDEHINKIGVDKFQMQGVLGQDVSPMFFPAANWGAACPGITNPGSTWDNIFQRTDKMWPHETIDPTTNSPSNYLGYLARYAKGRIGWQMDYISTITDPTKKIIVLFNNVYDVSAYFQGQSSPGFFDANMYKIFTNFANKDATVYMKSLMDQDPVYYGNVLNCMNNIFYMGTVDNRNSLKCQFSNIILLTASAVIVAVIGFKFLAALRSMHSSNPEDIDKYVITLVTCYTEGKDSLELTLESIACTEYDDRHKLAVVIADGMVTGGGNSKPTPDIVLEILCGSEEEAMKRKKDARKDLQFMSVAAGHRVENRGSVYSGLYEVKGHSLPYVVIVKTGNAQEKSQVGNRGKRDSQNLLFRFLHNVYGGNDMSELEYELYHQINDVLGTSPKKYEYMLMVDADTYITNDSLTKMVACMVSNKKLIGLCGETFVANEKDSITTMIQVYEYFISHHLAKSFESMFGSVTCLPGCFSMYRIRTSKDVPLLIAPALIEEYANPQVDTLHKKNLLSLGEDRFLTTLMMKHFPRWKTMFTPDAKCYTNVPDNFSVLMSQRRRWINSTIHNLVELSRPRLGSKLCGFCCVSMRFVVILDLISTLVAPASVVYVGYLIYTIAFEKAMIPIVSLIMIGAIYVLQAVIFLLKWKPEHIGWMIVYILAMPFFSFVMPIYAFWHMDEFKWGDTRIVTGEDGKEAEMAEDEVIDPRIKDSIVRRPIEQWRKLREEHESVEEEASHDDIIRIGTGFGPVPPPPMSVYQPTPYYPPQPPMSYYAPSHVTNYVNNYVPPSQYADSRWGGQSYYAGSNFGGDVPMASPASEIIERDVLSDSGRRGRSASRKPKTKKTERGRKREKREKGMKRDKVDEAQSEEIKMDNETHTDTVEEKKDDEWADWVKSIEKKE